ncbi:hypothetical protein GO496_10830 [Acidovorax citrulli]|nr:hypothetical protein [Paracidovorax citrulli]
MKTEATMAWTVIQTTSEGTRMSEYLSAEEGLKKIIAQRVEQANDLYALLGEFVVSFELLCQEMRQQLALLCAPAPHRQSDIFALDRRDDRSAAAFELPEHHGSSLPRRGQAVFQKFSVPEFRGSRSKGTISFTALGMWVGETTLCQCFSMRLV